MDNLFVLIKPASEKCNMNCSYCFYHDISSKREVKDYGFMTYDVMTLVIERAFESNPKHINFAFQGGEPTLWGLDNFETFVKYVKEIKKDYPHTRISYALQTNGTLITEDFAKFFHDNNFLIGLSLDGIRKINDKNRPYYNKKGTFDDVLRASRIFKEQKVAYNILAVVTSDHVGKEKEIYNFYKKNDFKFIQFIACLDPIDEKKGKQSWSLSAEDYLKFLNAMFKLWYTDFKNGTRIDIRYFTNVLSMLLGQQPESCDRRGICSIQNIIEADGSVYPCDFYVFENMKLGNLKDNSFEEMMNNDMAQEFVNRSTIVHDDCKKCEYYSLCRGGCYRNKSDVKGQLKTHYCYTYYNFFKQNMKQLEEVANVIRVESMNR